MTSVESHHMQQQQQSPAMGLQYGTATTEPANNGSSMDEEVSTPRFEAFVMTGSKILPSGRVSKANIRQDNSRSKVHHHGPTPAISPSNNIVLHSPVLNAARKSKSPQESASLHFHPDDLSWDAEKGNGQGDAQVIFQYRTHDIHQFHLASPHENGTVGKDVADRGGAPHSAASPVSSHGRLDPDTLLDGHLVNRQRPFTPEIVDDRPVWTVNAPVSALHSKSLPGSPSPRRSGQQHRYREILREETIITDTTISEVTDTKTSTSYILNSPRTPRHLPKDTEISPVLPPELEAASQDQGNRQDRSSPEMVVILPDDEVMDLPPEGHVHTNGLKLKSQAFVHPESARACMEIFPLQGMKLDEALRLFLTDVKLVGETEARQRVIDLFAMRYVECNPKSYYTRDCVNGVVSAMLILNSDLYSEHRPHHPLNLHSFMSSLQEIPACADLPEEELRWLYMSIKNEPLPVARVKDSENNERPNELTVERGASCKTGYLTRKSCREPGGKATRWGSRGWHRVFVVLTDMTLELYKKEPIKTNEEAMTTIPLHHGYATMAVDYKKHPLVLRFRAIDESVALFRASNEEEFDDWLFFINRTAALNSAPVSLPVGSQTLDQPHQSSARAFVRPLYASRKSCHTVAEQVTELKQSELRLMRQIQTLNTEEPGSRKEVLFMSAQLDFFTQELERTQTYLYVLGRH